MLTPTQDQRQARERARERARAHEKSLPSGQRKKLGQFFSGLPLGKLLAHLALQERTRSVIDPMCGNGDLLDAVSQASDERNQPIERLDGIEIDGATASLCTERVKTISPSHTESRIIAADAFDPNTVCQLPIAQYDLVITNPPYVRYQSQDGESLNTVRSNLIKILPNLLSYKDSQVWLALTHGYSGLSDLSVPSILLASALVKPGGSLALVVPATWRTRDYADTLRYLLLRCFDLETIVADTQPGWFSNALVRTNLIVARRRKNAEPIRQNRRWKPATWIDVAPTAASEKSLVGKAFINEHPDKLFSQWVQQNKSSDIAGLGKTAFDVRHEWEVLRPRILGRKWYQAVEANNQLIASASEPSREPAPLPAVMRQLLPERSDVITLYDLSASGIRVGQGLRTGCNNFFYVTALETGDDSVRVRTSKLFGEMELSVPSKALEPVIRRQSELTYLENGELPPGRVLKLRNFVLPEDMRAVEESAKAYQNNGEDIPTVMPTQLADYVRLASQKTLDGTVKAKLIPELSAVRTNVRAARNSTTPPSFWYMLPDFAPRHIPSALIPRVNSGPPWVEANLNRPCLVDANFSTLWSEDSGWTRHALKAVLNSAWCCSYMEAAGTQLGGGALKLEATHLRQLPLPLFSEETRDELDLLGKQLERDNTEVLSRIDQLVLRVAFPEANASTLETTATQLREVIQSVSSARQRNRS